MPDWNIRYHSFNITLQPPPPTLPPPGKKADPCLHQKCIWPCQGRFSAKAANLLAWAPHYIHNSCVSEPSNVLRVQEWLKGPIMFNLPFVKLVLAGYPLSGKKLCHLPNPQWLRQWAEFTSRVSPRVRHGIKDRSPSCYNPYPTAFPYGNGMVLHFYQQQESSTTKTVHKVINKGLKAYV